MTDVPKIAASSCAVEADAKLGIKATFTFQAVGDCYEAEQAVIRARSLDVVRIYKGSRIIVAFKASSAQEANDILVKAGLVVTGNRIEAVNGTRQKYDSVAQALDAVFTPH
jgi:uncharacterized protein with ACT and thioredoxin-like domain